MTSSSYPTRRTQRLEGYDYAQAGAYFVTLSLQERHPLLGRLERDTVHLSPPGMMMSGEWEALPERCPDVAVDVGIVMPDHVHGILVIGDGSLSLPEVVRTFKSRTTWLYSHGVKEQGWPRYHGVLWQRGYFDRVVRDEVELQRFREYIVTNPLRSFLRQQAR
jgi:putative transposase